MMLEIQVRATGLYDTLQDQGRAGHQSQGVPLGGALDRQSAALANQLVSNPLSAPVLESTLIGPTLFFHREAQVALTGGECQLLVDGKTVPRYTNLTVPAGAELKIGRIHTGCRTYLAIRGDWQVQRWLGSCSPPPFQAALLTPDSGLSTQQRIRIRTSGGAPARTIEAKDRPVFPNTADIPVYPGPEWDWFSRIAIADFFSQPFRLSNDIDRMGLRLETAIREASPLPSLISSAVLPGTVQVPPSGQPIVLMADAQTTGGYPRLAQVSSQALPRLAQLRPGDQIRFKVKDQSDQSKDTAAPRFR